MITRIKRLDGKCILIFLAVIVFAASAALRVNADTISVSSADALAAAIAGAPTDKTETVIIITQDIDYTDKGTQTISAGQNIIIKSDDNGPHTLYQHKSVGSRHFTTNGTLSLSNLILDGSSNGTSSTAASGGVTVNAGCTLNLNDITIQNCNSGSYVVNINGASAKCTINNSAIQYCTGSSGIVYVSNLAGKCEIDNSVVSDNNKTGIINKGETTIKNSVISNNTASATLGGGISSSTGNLNIENSSVTGNTAGTYGGGIALTTGTCTITDSTIVNNTAGTYGGGISFTTGTCTITDSTIGDNKASTNGGGIYFTTGTLKTSNTKGSSTNITGNTAAGNGGGIYTSNSAYTNITTDSATVFSGNYADKGYEAPSDADTTYAAIGHRGQTISTHPLNNYDISYTGETEISAYLVTFDSQGGSTISNQVLTGDSPKITMPDPNPTLKYNSFTGWYTQADDTGELWDFAAPVTANMTLYAHWDYLVDSGCTVTFDSQGGSEVASVTVDYDAPVSAPSMPAKAGYDFKGWYTDADCAAAYDFSAPVTDNITLYANWAAAPDGETVETFDELVAAINNASTQKNLYTITVSADISLDSAVSIAADKNIAIVSAGDTPFTLTQKKELVRHFSVTGTLSLGNVILDGSTEGSSATAAGGGIGLLTGSSLTCADTVIRYCSAASGGAIGSGSNMPKSVEITDTTITGNTATYGGGIYIVGNAATTGVTIADSHISSNTVASQGGGAVFLTLKSLNIKDTEISENHNTRDAGNGLYAANCDDITLENCVISHNDTDVDLSASQISGFGANGGGIQLNGSAAKIVGCTISDNSSVSGGGICLVKSSSVNISDNTSIIGNYAGTAAGGIYATSYSSIESDDTTVFRLNTAGTAYAPPSGADTAYPNIGYAACSISTHPLNNYDIYYATGTKITVYTAKFETNGADSDDIERQLIISGDKVTDPGDPIRDGYTFKGWYTDSGFSNKWDISSNTVSADITLYAQWQDSNIASHTVNFDSSGGTTVSSQSVSDGGYATEPTAPTRSGYVFKGWYTDANAVWSFKTNAVTGDMTLYAKWETSNGDLIHNEEELNTAIAEASGDTTIYLANDLEITASVTLTAGKSIAIKGTDGGPYTITQTASSKRHFTLAGGDTGSAYLTMEGIVLDGGSNGGGVELRAYSHLTVTGSTIKNCKSGTYGAIYIPSGGSNRSLTIENSSIINSTASYGAAICVNGSIGTVNIKNSIISGNSSTNGAIYINGSANDVMNISDGTQIINNSATNGGGIYTICGSVTNISDSTISGNTASSLGGGVYQAPISVAGHSAGADGLDSSINISGNTTISNNTAGTNGGGIYSGGSSMYLKDSATLAGNVAGTSGGGIYTALTDYSNVHTQTNTVFRNNSAATAYAPPSGADSAFADILYSGASITSAAQRYTSLASLSLMEDDQQEDTELSLMADAILEHPLNNFDINYTGASSDTLIVYIVKYETLGGGLVEQQVLSEVGYMEARDNPVLESAAFQGWYDNSDGTGAAYTTSTYITESTTLYALWLNTYEVTFISSGNSNIVKSVSAGGTVEAPSVSVPDGYTLVGWFTGENGTGTQWDFAAGTVSGDISLYAYWQPTVNDQPETVVVTFDSDGGTSVGGQTVNKDSTLSTPEDPAKSGYTFVGWYTEKDGGGSVWSFSNAVSEDMTLYAKWNAVSGDTSTTVAVTFDSDGGSSVSSQTIEKGKLITEPTAPTRSGYSFAGWYTGKDGVGSAWSFVTGTVSANMTLYAKWTEGENSTFAVKFDSDGGTAVDTQYISANGLANKPEDPSKDGYTFLGWYTEDGEAWDFGSDTVTSNITLYAKWSSDTAATGNTSGTGANSNTGVSGTSGNSGSSSGSGSTKTGDDTNMLPYIIGLVISGALVCLLVVYRVKIVKRRSLMQPDGSGSND